MSDTSHDYLISLFIGPVQDFIAAALRTRDLWFGSYMLSEVSRAAASAMAKADSQVQLIFPLQESINQKEANIANRIMAMVHGDMALAKQLGAAGKKAARDRMGVFFTEAYSAAGQIANPCPVVQEIWNIQADPDDLLELYFTAVPFTGDYKTTRKRLDQLTFARKNSREFRQSTASPYDDVLFGKPKSSLDGRRETVLVDIKELDSKNQVRAMRKLRLRNKGEQLDAMGLVKRLAGGKVEQFTPTTRIAVDPWIRSVRKTEAGKESIAKICEKFDRLADKEAAVVTRVKGNESIYQDMPYDAGLLYPGPLGTAIRDSENEEEKKILRRVQSILSSIWNLHSKPCPYYAMILADGDFMGDLLKEATNKEDHQAISTALAKFAGDVPRLTRSCRGHCIYAGGDDVLLMVPLDKALELADLLQQAFSQYMRKIAEKMGQKVPTFSVGLVMAHMQTPLGRVRRLVAEAEELAKGTESEQPRNGLGILIAPRSGADIRVRIRWDSDTLAHFICLVDLYRNELLPAGFAHELQTLSHALPESEDDGLDVVRSLEIERILGRKNVGGGDKKIDEETQKRVLQHAADRPLSTITREHLAARWLSGHTGGTGND